MNTYNFCHEMLFSILYDFDYLFDDEYKHTASWNLKFNYTTFMVSLKVIFIYISSRVMGVEGVERD